MGKSKKSKNAVSQESYFADSASKSCDRGAPAEFLTSDNFCVVQKKNVRKFHDEEGNPVRVSRSRSNSGKNSLFEDIKENENRHKSFWKQKSDGSEERLEDDQSGEDSSADADTYDNTLTQASVVEEKMKILKNSVIMQSENIDASLACGQAKKMDAHTSYYDTGSVKPSSDFPVEKIGFELLLRDEQPSCWKEIPADSTEPEFSSCVDDLSCKSTCSVAKSSKKKKRKELKKGQIDEEIEKILLELEASGKKENVTEARKTNKKSTVKNVRMEGFSHEVESDAVGDRFEKTEKSGKHLMTRNVEICSENDLLVKSGNVCKDENSVNTVSQKKEKKIREKLKKQEKCEIAKEEVALQESNASCTSDNQEFSAASGEESENTQKPADIKKRPGKKQLALMQEAVKKAKEEEERLNKEEEARQKAAEEAERQRLEKLRLEQAKKEKKKLKEKQRREKMKAEGRLLSKSQKQSRARMEATLAVLRQQGIDVPQIGEKRPRLSSYKSLSRKRTDSSCSNQENGNTVITSDRKKSASLSSQESKESLSDLPSSYDSGNSWDINFVEEVLTADSETGHLSCSEESDVPEENSCIDECALAKDIVSTKLKPALNSDFSIKSFSCSAENAKDMKLRSPVVCVLGHVDTGKTKILDYIRKTHVQDSEAGGITQQIGATMIPREALKAKCKMVKNFSASEVKVPGLLVIDTPGHESFGNLRSRGSSICDIAVLVVDIMHGLEPQTLESINLLKKRKTPFVVALNKIDRIYGWKSIKDEDVENVIKRQSLSTQGQFRKRCQEVIVQFANECLNAALFFENKDPRTFVSMVPTSAITGDGMGNILSLVVQLTQTMMQKKLIFSEDLEATVLEVKAIPGLGTTIDVILVNGRLHEGDTIVLAGHDGPMVTQIRSLLMPQPLKELRVKNPYTEYKTVEGSQGVKITGRDLDRAIAGLPLLVARNQSSIDLLKEEMAVMFRETINSIKTSDRGVYVQASTLGSLEALVEFLNSSSIPYFSVKIGPVVKKDVVKASIMLEHDSQYAAILAFDVKIERDAQELADSLGVRIFHADIIYHLFDMYMKYREDLQLKKREETKRLAVFPCKLRILPEFVFSAKDPIFLGVSVEAGTLKEGTPICIPSRDNLEIGTVTTIEANNKQIGCAGKGEEVCVKIEHKPGDSPKVYGRHFDHEDLLVSRLSRQSIDVCKEFYRKELLPSDWHLIVELKKLLHIV